LCTNVADWTKETLRQRWEYNTVIDIPTIFLFIVSEMTLVGSLFFSENENHRNKTLK
jgi:hypothetical protein